MNNNKSENKSWVVKVRQTITSELVCEGCTQEEAEDQPFLYSIQHHELGQEDYEVLSVEPNE